MAALSLREEEMEGEKAARRICEGAATRALVIRMPLLGKGL